MTHTIFTLNTTKALRGTDEFDHQTRAQKMADFLTSQQTRRRIKDNDFGTIISEFEEVATSPSLFREDFDATMEMLYSWAELHMVALT